MRQIVPPQSPKLRSRLIRGGLVGGQRRAVGRETGSLLQLRCRAHPSPTPSHEGRGRARRPWAERERSEQKVELKSNSQGTAQAPSVWKERTCPSLPPVSRATPTSFEARLRSVKSRCASLRHRSSRPASTRAAPRGMRTSQPSTSCEGRRKRVFSRSWSPRAGAARRARPSTQSTCSGCVINGKLLIRGVMKNTPYAKDAAPRSAPPQRRLRDPSHCECAKAHPTMPGAPGFSLNWKCPTPTRRRSSWTSFGKSSRSKSACLRRLCGPSPSA